MIIFIGCGDKDEPVKPSLIGNWYIRIDTMGITLYEELILKDDGTYWLYTDTPWEQTENTGTYTINGNKIAITDDEWNDETDDDRAIGNAFFETGRDKNGD
jgi:hypothetical protein